MWQMWREVTEAQATIIAALLTIVAAIVGVILGARLFGNRVKDLESAVKATEMLVESHKDKMQQDFAELQRTFAEGFGQLRGDFGEIINPAEEAAQQTGDDAPWEKLRSDWNAIRDELERRAADPEIDGRTRAKYARLDRRKYWALIESLDYDGHLGNQSKSFYAANQLWQRFKSGKRPPDASALSDMDNLKKRLVGVPG